jgi:hypothetical protein
MLVSQMVVEHYIAYLFAMWLCSLVLGKDWSRPYILIENKIALKVDF